MQTKDEVLKFCEDKGYMVVDETAHAVIAYDRNMNRVYIPFKESVNEDAQ